jgi:tetratricopeptide (TPR) repeat protein
MRTGIWVLLLFCAAACAQDSAENSIEDQGLPGPAAPVDELAPLKALIKDEDRVVEALRQYHLSQEALFQIDIELAQSYSKEGDVAAAKAKTEHANERLNRVREAYDIVLSHYPRNPEALNYAGELLYDHYGEYASAIQNWRMAAAMDKDFGPPRNNLSLHYFHHGDYDLGFRYMDEALKLEPNNPDYLYNAVQIYMIHFPEVMERKGWKKEKVYKEAMKLSQRAAELLPDDYDLQEDYAVNFFAAENFEVETDWQTAARAWQTARAQARNSDELFYTWLNEARAWSRAGNWAQAEACVTEALSMRPESAAAQTILESVQQQNADGA